MASVMRSLLAILAIVALVVGAGCGDKSDSGTTPSDKTMKDAGDAATPEDAGDAAGTTMKDAGDAAKAADITYACAACGKAKTLASASPAPS